MQEESKELDPNGLYIGKIYQQEDQQGVYWTLQMMYEGKKEVFAYIGGKTKEQALQKAQKVMDDCKSGKVKVFG